MKQRNVVILKIGDGNLDKTGFAFNLQVWHQGQERLNCDGRLPAATAVRDRFEDWTETANNLGHAYLISLPTVQVTNVDIVDNCRTAAIAFEAAFNQWLMQGVVVNSLIVPLVQAMPQAQGLKFFIQTSDPLLQRLPWQVWQFLSQTYPDAEVILSSAERPKAVRLKLPVRILAIEGDTSGTTATLDLTPIELIPGMTITLLKQPTQTVLRDHLWHESWDMLLFMGHSRSQSRTGEIALNASETLSLDDLHDALQFSVENGLKLAIFNSCDGVGIASKLADLKIPYTIAMRHRIPDVIAQVFLQTFLIAFAKGRSVHEAVYTARRKLQESQSRFPYAAWLPVIYQNPAAPEIRYPKPLTIGRRWKYFLLSFIGLISAVMLTMLYRSLTPKIVAQPPNLELQQAQIYATRTSLGGQLLGDYSTADRTTLQPALTAFNQQQYDQAQQQFQAFLQTHPESPEITIYASNAAIRSGKAPAIGRIAASVPIGGNNPGTAEEMLRGMAQAQAELRQRQPIEIMIVADSNGIAKDGKSLMPIIAPKIIADAAIKAVIGPNASDAARDSADLYDKGRLLMITPTAFFDAFSGMGNHVYRMLPTKREFTKPMAQYAKQHGGKIDRIIVCEDSRSADNQAVAEAFKATFGRAKVSTPDNCIPTANAPMTSLTVALQEPHIRKILIAPHIEHMADALRVAQAAKRQGLVLLGTPTFFADNILSDPATAQSLEGMVLYTPWSPSKADRAKQNIFTPRWHRHVTWRTATSYDAFQMVAAGLAAEFKQTGNTTRNELYNFFKQHQTTASHNGITGKIQFTEKGDRTNHLPYGELLEIKQVNPGNWQFVPIPPSSATIAS
jgi:branched-chain amino acid transport system substrate-binding protein